jgi:hypothetical protein
MILFFRRVCALLLIGVTLLLCGCLVGVSRTRYSVPYVDDPKVAARHDFGDSGHSTFSFDDLKLSVYSANEMNDREVLLFPIPWSSKIAPGSSTTFSAFIGIRPNKDGFVLDAADIYLIRSNNERVKPTRIYNISECGKNRSAVEWSWLPIEPFVLRRGVCRSFTIEFPTHPPDPTENFSMDVAGLSLDGAPRSVLEVRFREAKRLDPIGAP